MFYVYEHIRLDKSIPFYVGKGSGERAYTKGSRNKFWHNITRKAGYKVNILYYTEEEEKALVLERLLQIEYTRSGYKLCNLIECGKKGVSGIKHSSKTKRMIADASKRMWKNKESKIWLRPSTSGLDNYTADRNIYSFYHPDHGIVYSTKFELRDKYNLDDSKIYMLVSGKRFEHKRWRMLINKDKNKPIYDNNKYKWYHSTYGVVISRKVDLMKRFPELLQPNLCKVIKKVQNSHKGWSIIEGPGK